MKKSLKALLLSLSCLCFVTAMGCSVSSLENVTPLPPRDSVENESDSSSSESESASDSETPTPEGTLAVNFIEGEGYTFETDIPNGYLAYEGETVSFRIKQSVFYDGSPVVKVNGESQSHDDGVYNVKITEASDITVEGIYKSISELSTGTRGDGSFDNAFVVSEPIDLLYIAEQVNKGVYEYVTGAYVLANDIDCGGEELQIIGDMSTDNSYFSGCFTCYTNPDTNEMIPATISNFVINSENANYVGLFGTVYCDLSVTSSGLFYGINLADFTINARLSEDMMVANRSISAGSLIGYGVGANLYVCSATNGSINVYGDDSYFSFVGGLIGYQQAFYMADYDMSFSSEVVYSHTDVDIRIMKGMSLYAGGITGYLATNVPSGATAFIHNSYSSSNVNGSLRAGGIAGGLGQYTSVGNCYASGKIFAKASQSLDDILLTDTEYCYSNAGGIVGFAENDTVVSDCFFAGTTSATAASAGCSSTHDIIGGGYEKGYASAAAERYVINNCLTSTELGETMAATNAILKDKFSWAEHDWTFDDKSYPTITYASATGQIQATITLQYVSNDGTDVKVNGQSSWSEVYFDTQLQAQNVFAPMGNYFVNGSLARILKADVDETLPTAQQKVYLSYGYFFDEACTQKVPYSYVPQRNITLYIGFADATPLMGTYQLTNGNTTKALEVTFDNQGYATYSDGATSQTSYYFFDGENIIIEGARLARYYDGAIIVDEDDTSLVADAYFDLYRYNYYDFVGAYDGTNLTLYDGVYFTADSPLTAYKDLFIGERYTADGTAYKFYGDKATAENGASYIEYTYVKVGDQIILNGGEKTLNISDLIPFDAFKGTWTKSATINKTYTFDGMGNWSYEYISYERIMNGYNYTYEERLLAQESGTYTINSGTLTLSNGTTAWFNEDGILTVKENGKDQLFYTENSYVGIWQYSNVSIALHGIGKNGYGEATLTYSDGTVYDLVYEASETDGYICLYWAHDVYAKDALFGYFTYDRATNTLLATLTDTNNLTTGYTQGNLFVVDDYVGEWISDAEDFENVEFEFNGNGLYGFLYGYAGMEGEVTLRIDNGTSINRTTLTYTLDSSLNGRFSYNGQVWSMHYDEYLKAVILSVEGKDDAQLQRKDELASLAFVTTDGTTYRFDGRSRLIGGGTVEINGVEYGYQTSGNGWTIENVGTLTLAPNKAYYVLDKGNSVENLYLDNEFMGKWAVGGEFNMFEIGPSDLNGKIQAVFKGHKVELTTLEPNLLTFKYRENNMPITYYVFVVPDDVLGYSVLVLSQYANLYSGGYSICTKANELYGEWIGKSFTLTFDGIESGAYSYGQAILARGAGETSYNYRTSKHGTVMWSQVALGGEIWYYDIITLNIATDDLSGADVFVQKDADGNVVAAIKRVRRTSVDDLLFATATDNAGNRYFFYGNNVNGANGDLYVNDQLTHSYKILKNDSQNKLITLEITEKSTNTTYHATLNYSVNGQFILQIDD